VITGETGTGKSMTFSALSFLMGEQGDYEEGTAVEAEIVLEDEEFILRREISRGRSRFYLNGSAAPKRWSRRSSQGFTLPRAGRQAKNFEKGLPEGCL
jgi:DNA repair ATPase RecN